MKTLVAYYPARAGDGPPDLLAAFAERLPRLLARDGALFVSDDPRAVAAAGGGAGAILLAAPDGARDAAGLWTAPFLKRLFDRTGVAPDEEVLLVDAQFPGLGEATLDRARTLFAGDAARTPVVGLVPDAYSPIQLQCAYDMPALGEIVLLEKDGGDGLLHDERIAGEVRELLGRQPDAYALSHPFFMHWARFGGGIDRQAPSLVLEMTFLRERYSGPYLITAARRRRAYFNETAVGNAYLYCGDTSARRLRLRRWDGDGPELAGLPPFGDEPGFAFACFGHQGRVGLYANERTPLGRARSLRLWPIGGGRARLADVAEHDLPRTLPETVTWAGQRFRGPLAGLATDGLTGFYFALLAPAPPGGADHLEPAVRDFSGYPGNYTYEADLHHVDGRPISGRQSRPRGFSLSTALSLGRAGQLGALAATAWTGAARTMPLAGAERLRVANAVDLARLDAART